MHANLAVSIRILEIHEYMVYRNEYRSNKSLTTLSLSFILREVDQSISLLVTRICGTSKDNIPLKYSISYHHWSNLESTEA